MSGDQPASLGEVLGPPVQLAYAVDDVFASAQVWAERFGAGPFFVAEHIPVTDVIYRGEPGVFDHSSAYGQWGKIMVELVCDHGTANSPVREMYQPGQTGLHHVAYIVANLAATTQQLGSWGYALAMEASAGTTRFHFVDATEHLGHFVELYEPSDGLLGFYAMVRAAADGWDGTKPVRSR